MNKTIYPNIVRGGIAIPLDRRNYFLVKGKTHEQGGIDIGSNPKTGLEVEDGEIVKMENGGIKVYSAVPMLAGKSPAERVLMGEDPNKVFAAQETFKKVNGFKDDGTKARLGRQKAVVNAYNNSLIKGSKNTNNKSKNLVEIRQSNNKFAGLKTHDNRGYNSDYMNYIYDSLSKSNLNKMQQAVILSHIINESGGDPFALNKKSGKDYGLLQWVDRYTKTKETDPYKEIDNQLNYIYSTVNNLDDKVSWTHGGEGSGYQSLNDAYSDFSSEDLSAVNKGFSLGYVRPAGKHDSANNRFGLAEQIYNRIKRLGGNMKHKLVEINIGGNSKLIRVPSRSSTGESERSEGRRKALLGSPTKKYFDDGTVHVTQEPVLRDLLKLDYDQKDIINLIKSTTSPAKPISANTMKINPINERTHKSSNKSGIWGDIIGVGSNIIGSLITRGINNKMIDNLKPPTMPVLETARKLNTKYNINPQEEAIKENLAAYEREVAGNTGSSRIALARINKGRNLATSQLVNLYGQKENIETQLRNQDTMNQQTVAARNIERINRHLTDVTNFDNKVTEMRADNNVSTVQNINQGVQDLLARRDRRTSFNKTLMAKTFANPNLPAELFYAAGIWDKNTYDMYRKQYAK